MIQLVWFIVWVVGIKVNRVKDINFRGNVVVGLERFGFYIRGYSCFFFEVFWFDNVVYLSFYGFYFYQESGFDNCIGIFGFLVFKNFDYGVMLYVENSVEMENIILVDNVVGFLVVVYVLFVLQSFIGNVQIVFRNLVIVVISFFFDCIQDRIKFCFVNSILID